jgi:hypothetical protein
MPSSGRAYGHEHQALNSPTVQNGMRDILLNHARLWEFLRARAVVSLTER